MQLPRALKETITLPRTLGGWLIIGTVLAFSAIAYRLTANLPILFWVGSIGALLLGLFAFKNMTAALTLVLLSSATTGITISTGRADPLPASMVMIAILTIVWFIRMITQGQKISLRPSPINIPVIAFLIAAIISWISGYGIWDLMVQINKNIFIVQVGQFAIFGLSFAAMLLAYQQNLKVKDLQTWNWIVVAIGVGGMLFEILTGTTWTRSHFGLTGTLFVLPIILVAAQLIFNPDLKIGVKFVSVMILLSWIYWISNNMAWKGGWLPSLVGLMVLAFFRSRKLFVVSVLLFAVVLVINWQGLVQNLIVPEVNSTSTIRPIIWLDIMRMVLPRSPIVGLGLANYMYYWYDPSFVSQARLAAGPAFINNYTFVIPSHNMFVDIFAQTGLIGFGLFLWLVISILRVLYRNIKDLEPGFLLAYTIGVFAGFLSMLVGSFMFADWLIPFVYNINITGFRQSVYMWILLGGAMAVPNVHN